MTMIFNIKFIPPITKKNFQNFFSLGYFTGGIHVLRQNKSTISSCDGKAEKWPTGSRVNYEFHPETEAIFNKQINVEFKAFYHYLSMAGYFGRVDVALPGCESFFAQMHDEEHRHALQFLNYVKMRGGKINLCTIQSPNNQDWKCPLNAFKTALAMEIEITDQLGSVNEVAMKHGDVSASDFIVTHFMEDQMKSISEMARFVTILSGIGDETLPRFLFDKDLLDNRVSPEFNVLEKKSWTDSNKRK